MKSNIEWIPCEFDILPDRYETVLLYIETMA